MEEDFVENNPSDGSKPVNKTNCRDQCDCLNQCFLKVAVKKEGPRKRRIKTCNQCDFKSTDLRYHMFKHSGEKTNKCNQCEFKTFLAKDLKPHMETHSVQKLNKLDRFEVLSRYFATTCMQRSCQFISSNISLR